MAISVIITARRDLTGTSGAGAPARSIRGAGAGKSLVEAEEIALVLREVAQGPFAVAPDLSLEQDAGEARLPHDEGRHLDLDIAGGLDRSGLQAPVERGRELLLHSLDRIA